MQESTPTLQEWRDLYQATIEFKKIECWNWLSDTDLFGVQNPANGITGYCCIMGELKETLGLVVYLGTEGLTGYLKIQSEENSQDPIDFLLLQRCLTVTFEGRKYLREPDLKIVKSLGLKFRGQQDWPLFRNYQPGYLPWYLNGEEVLYLTALIPQVMEVALRIKEKTDLLTSSRKNGYLVRIPERVGETLGWKEEWLEPSPVKKTGQDVPSVDELHLQRIKRNASRRQGVWEIDQFYSPSVVNEGERPYFPYVFLWVDHDTGLVLNVRVAGLSNYQADFQDQLMGLLEKLKFIPNEIWFGNEEPLKISEPIASTLGIKLTRVNRLPALEKAKKHLFSFFETGKP
jgi:hypothetical protein